MAGSQHEVRGHKQTLIHKAVAMAGGNESQQVTKETAGIREGEGEGEGRQIEGSGGQQWR